MPDRSWAFAIVLLTAPLACAPGSADVQEALASSASAGCNAVELRQKVSAGPTVSGRINPSNTRETLRLNHVLTAVPPCAGEIIHFDGSRILMKDGRTFRIEGLTTREVHGFYAFDRNRLRYELNQSPRNSQFVS